MSRKIKGYDVTVRGTYYGADGKDRILKVFGPVTFFLPEVVEIPNGKKKIETKTPDNRTIVRYEPQTAKRSVTVENVALYVIQRQLLPTWLQEKHPEATGFRTCSIVPGGMRPAVRPESEALLLNKPLEQMSLQEVRAFAKLRGIDLPLEAVVDADSARQMVQIALGEKGAPQAPAVDRSAPEKPAGVRVSEGPVTSADGIPTDEEDPTAGLL